MASRGDGIDGKKNEGGNHRVEQQASPERSCNFLVMSNAGKPIYSRRGDEEQVGRICGLLQAIRSSIQSNHHQLGDIRSLRSGRLCLVFMSVGSLTLVAIGGKDDADAYLKLQLEYIFGQIMFTLTARVVEEYFAFDLSFDLRTMLGNTDSVIHGILDECSPSFGNNGNGYLGHYLFGAIETQFPISPSLRARASTVLQTVGIKTEFTAFSLLTIADKLITMIQPSFPAHQMRVSDLHLLLHVLNRQPALLGGTSELWIPVCLPRFSSEDFLFCYALCLDTASKLCLVMVSQQSTTQQFQLFRQAAATIRRSLDLPAAFESVLEILPQESTEGRSSPNSCTRPELAGDVTSRDVKWRRNMDMNENQQGYVDASGDGDSMIPYLPSPKSTSKSTSGEDCGVFLREIRAACKPETIRSTMDNYLSIGSALHFVFRLDVPLPAAIRQGHPGNVPQSVNSRLGYPFLDEASKRKVWNTYTKLRLRLCLGSATPESTMAAFGSTSPTAETAASMMDLSCPAVCFASSSPERKDGIAYVIDGTELYLGMNGPDYE